ncbi:MAG: nucleotidyl transferase AbiEii/AbiGii toxin family protein [Egibacteraceae bacterium]
MTFFGGTALCRTHLFDWRLSEDIDLLVDDAGADRAGARRAARTGAATRVPRYGAALVTRRSYSCGNSDGGQPRGECSARDPRRRVPPLPHCAHRGGPALRGPAIGRRA